MIATELFPGPTTVSDADLAAHCRRTVKTNYHPVGTCRMGRDSDPDAVVTPDLKVRGVEGLRVVDASIMPTIPSGNTNAPVLAIADKAANLVMGIGVASPCNPDPPPFANGSRHEPALELASLGSLPSVVARPRYGRDALRAGILHIGVGNFHRAHQAVYLDDLFNAGKNHDWALLGAGVRPGDAAMRATLSRRRTG